MTGKGTPEEGRVAGMTFEGGQSAVDGQKPAAGVHVALEGLDRSGRGFRLVEEENHCGRGVFTRTVFARNPERR
jgi:hypothetical protein